MQDALKSKKHLWITLVIAFAVLEIAVIALSSSAIMRIAGTVANACFIMVVGHVLYYGWNTTWNAIKNNKKISVVFVLSFLFECAIAASCYRNYLLSTAFGQYVMLFQTFMLPSVLLGLFGIYIWKLDTWKLYLMIGTLLGIGIMMMIPVGGVPDEMVHVAAAYRVSNTLLGVKEQATGIVMRADDLKNLSTDLGRNMYFDINGYESYIRAIATPLQDGSLVHTEYMVLDMPVFYFVPAIGITIGRLLSLGTYATLLLGRITNFAMYMALTTYAIKKIPFGKLSMLVLLLMPVELQQAMSYSYDVPVNATALIAIAFTVKIILSKDDKILSRKELIAMLITSLVLFPSKGKAYFLISLLPWFSLLWKKHPLKPQTLKRIVCVFAAVLLLIIVAVVVWNYTGAANYQYSLNTLTYEGSLPEPLQGYSLGYFIAHPFDLVKIYGSTVMYYTSYYYGTFVGSELAWLDIAMPNAIIIMYTVLLFFASIKRTGNDVAISKRAKLLFFAVSLLTFCFILGGMLIGWTPVTSGVILGVQGRYMFPFALLVLLLLGSNLLQIDAKIDNLLVITLVLTAFTSVEYLCLHL